MADTGGFEDAKLAQAQSVPIHKHMIIMMLIGRVEKP
jgi:hypothetical protein